MTVDCPQPDNMAAVALQMQETALQAEQELYAAELAFAAALNRPTWVVDLTTSVTGIPPFVEFDLFASGGGTYVERFNNCGVPVKEFGQIRIPFTGLWQVGMALRMVPSGAIDDNTYRNFVLEHARQTAASALGYENIWRETSDLFETSVGTLGTDGVVIAEFSAQAHDIIKIFVDHGNTSSNVDVPNSPNPRFWGTLLSTADQIQVT